jgi:hypothetical protein
MGVGFPQASWQESTIQLASEEESRTEALLKVVSWTDLFELTGCAGVKRWL